MNNKVIEEQLFETESELKDADALLNLLGISSNIYPYICKYSIVRACGTIESSFKAIIADTCTFGASSQVQNYINKNVKENSSNPTYDNICKMLNNFDENWLKRFKEEIKQNQNDRLLDSLKSLVDARNSFAHGGNPTLSIQSVIEYFSNCVEVIKILDSICMI